MSKAIAAKKEQAMVVGAADVPDFLRDKMQDNRGSEEVGASDLVIPRIELVQDLSKARKKADPAFIEGAESGMLYNNVTRKLYGASVRVCPVYFRVEYLLWRDQKLGGGFGGAFPDKASAQAALNAQEKPEEWEVVDTNQHFVIIVNEDGTMEDAAISMAKSKSKVSRNWNSLVKINGGPRFSRLYDIFGVTDKNKAGQDYYNLSIKNVGYVTQEIFSYAEKVYEMVSSGRATIDRTVDDDMSEAEEM